MTQIVSRRAEDAYRLEYREFLHLPDARACQAIVGPLRKLSRSHGTPNRGPAAARTFIASNECPPKSKKLPMFVGWPPNERGIGVQNQVLVPT
ncbi:MAG TPA: hypothetical protein VMF06_13310 [Candidatus Limnocylindria bacterium]|jgi:hypothetical protein|nr:hypothetical protein [Candidatus Limnocylindria bacterium]